MIPIELYAHVVADIDDKEDLVTLSVVSPTWRIAAESRLWSFAVLIYDDPDPDNLDIIEYLIRHAAPYVRHLEIDYCGQGDDAVKEKAMEALSEMVNIVHVDICGTDELPGKMLLEKANPAKIHTVKYAGPSSPTLFSFLQNKCPRLASLVLSNNLEPVADYSLLRQPWKALTTFSGNILHTASILRSGSRTLRDVTVHLNPSIMSLKSGWGEDMPSLETVESFGVGDLNGYPPVYIDHVLGDMGEAMCFFPNLTHLRRIPFHERLNKQKILTLLSSSTQLTYVSLLDYNPEVKSERGKNFAKEIKAKVCNKLEKMVVCPCPNKGGAFVYVHSRSDEDDWKNRTIDIDVNNTVV